MVQNTVMKPLGTVLLRGGLVSPAQVEVALVDQRSHPSLRLGDVLELRGWLHRATLDFFSEEWPRLVAGEAEYPIGVYLQQAGLLTPQQVDLLLEEQLQTGLRIGALAVLRGWIKQETLDLLLQGIAPEHHSDSVFKPLRPIQAEDQGEDPAGSNPDRTQAGYDATEEEIPWVD